jgi:hypothetical protein
MSSPERLYRTKVQYTESAQLRDNHSRRGVVKTSILSVKTARRFIPAHRKPTMKRSRLVVVMGLAISTAISPVLAQVSSETMESISTPDKVETPVGTLEFKDGMPSKETLDKVYDNLDRAHAFQAFVNTMQGSTRLPFIKASLTSE